jgi:predicted HicB family RNase H-like nuclease
MMKNNILEYKGYHTKVEFDSEELVLRGKIEGINDFVNFECEDIKNIEKEFHEAVDDYLEFCKEVGKEPDKEYKGTFNVRISPAVHKELVNVAMKNGDTLNASVEKAIKEYVSDMRKTEIQ